LIAGGEADAAQQKRRVALGKENRPTVEARVCHAIRLLAQGQPADDVARAIHVLPKTLAAWQDNADFQALLACMRENGRLRAALDRLEALTPDAIEALHRALEGENDRVAVQAAREVLDRVGLIRRTEIERDESSEKVIRVEYKTPDGKPFSAPPWSERNPIASGALQSGGVRETLRQDGDGQDADD
jgi:hypothetical protein